MDISKLSHDKAKVSSALLYKEQAIIAKAAVKIMIPSRYFDVGIAITDPETYTMAVFAIIVEDKFFSCALATTLMKLTPTDRYEIMVEEEAYTIFEFDKGAVITPNRNLIVRDTLIYDAWESYISKTKWPWYVTDENVSIIFEDARKWTGVQLGGNPAIVQMIFSTIIRTKGNLNLKYRHALIDNPTAKAEPVDLRSIIYGPSNTFSRLNGPYAREGLPTALVNQSERSEPFEELIRR